MKKKRLKTLFRVVAGLSVVGVLAVTHHRFAATHSPEEVALLDELVVKAASVAGQPIVLAYDYFAISKEYNRWQSGILRHEIIDDLNSLTKQLEPLDLNNIKPVSKGIFARFSCDKMTIVTDFKVLTDHIVKPTGMYISLANTRLPLVGFQDNDHQRVVESLWGAAGVFGMFLPNGRHSFVENGYYAVPAWVESGRLSGNVAWLMGVNRADRLPIYISGRETGAFLGDDPAYTEATKSIAECKESLDEVLSKGWKTRAKFLYNPLQPQPRITLSVSGFRFEPY